MANTEFVGKKLNVESRKGVHQETITKQFVSKGIVRTAEGGEYAIADIRKKGRGLFITVAGVKPKAAPTAASAAPAENVRKVERTAAAVTFDEIEGKKIDGKAVVKVMRRAGTVKLEDGSEVEITNVSRKGRGYTTEAGAAAVPAPKATSTRAKASVKPSAEGEAVTNADIRPAVKAGGVKIRIDGKLQTIIATVTGEKFKTDKGFKGETSEIRNIGGKYVLETAEYKAANAPAPAPKAEAKPSRAPAPITRTELKGKNITIGEVLHVIEKTFKDNTVETNEGFRFSVEDVARKGRGYIYTGEIAQKGGAVPKHRPAPEPVNTIVEVGAFDYDTTTDIRDLLEKAVRRALADSYDVDVSGSFVQYEDQIATISFQIHTADAPAALVKSKVESFRSSMNAQAIAEPAPAAKRKAKLDDDGADFDPAELADEDDEDEDEDESSVVGVDYDDSDLDSDDEDDTDDSDDSDDTDDDEQFADEDEVTTASDDDDDEDDTDFPDEAPVETSFPEDPTAQIESGVARLSKLFPNKTMNGFVSRWYASQDAFDAVGYDIEPGLTITIDGDDYALVGLKGDGSVLLVNTETSGARPNIDLDALQILVEEDKHA